MGRSPETLRFVIIPKVAHPWFEEVRLGAQMQAEFLARHSGKRIVIDYLPPSRARVAEQDAVVARAAATLPSGIAIDPVDALANLPAVRAARDRGIPILVFDSPSSDPTVASVGNDFAEQGVLAARHLVGLIGRAGEVAIMQGVATAPNHRQRYLAQLEVLRRHSAITVVDGGTDNDDIPTAEQQATTTLNLHPHLSGYLCCDAAGPIGIAAAIRKVGKVGRVKAVGMDGIEPILREIKDGVLDGSAATIPSLQGSMALLMLWEAANGMRIPMKIDTGIDFITADNVDAFLAAAEQRRSAPALNASAGRRARPVRFGS
jgi:ribose transport system substrate-binding protein